MHPAPQIGQLKILNFVNASFEAVHWMFRASAEPNLNKEAHSSRKATQPAAWVMLVSTQPMQAISFYLGTGVATVWLGIICGENYKPE